MYIVIILYVEAQSQEKCKLILVFEAKHESPLGDPCYHPMLQVKRLLGSVDFNTI